MFTDEAREYAAKMNGTDGSEAVGPGRGSGVSSLCNYCLGVTDVDPVKHNFLIQKMFTDEAREYAAKMNGTDGSEAVGPGRGSGVSSLCNYCLGVTDVDPVKHNLLFPRFISEARCGRKMKLRFRNLEPVRD
jgi:DNA polymerase III alpha subunit